MKPKILISAIKIDNYIAAVNNCGGVAYGGYCPEFSADYDGLLLAGGSDVDPKYYNEEINGSKGIDNKRDALEFELIKAFVKLQKPILGICRGCQILNIAFGGSMHQHIPNFAEHSYENQDVVHNITATNGSFLHKLYGSEFPVNSRHHQAVKLLGNDIEIVSKTTDGTIVEAIAHKNLPIIGVQFHPERMCFEHKREDTVDGSEIFKYFISMCKSTADK